MITQVALKNWKSHLDSQLSFSEGTNCLIGIMGSGKSSLLESISFALFGTFPQLQQKKLRLEDIIMKKPKRQQSAEIQVVFELGDDEYKVKRKIEKVAASARQCAAELRKNGELVEVQPQKVTEEIERILKINYDLFSRAVYSEQNQLDMFLTIPKGQRMRKIDELLGLNKFESARASVVALTNRCNSAISEKQNVVLSLEKDEALRETGSLQKELAKAEEEKNNFEKQLDAARASKKETSLQLSELKRQEKSLREIEEQIKTYSALIESLESDAEQIKNDLVDTAEKTDEELAGELKDLVTHINDLKQAIENEKANLGRLREVIAGKNAKANLIESEKLIELRVRQEEKKNLAKLLKSKNFKILQQKIEKLRKRLEETKNKLSNTVAQIAEKEQLLKEIVAAEAVRKCPLCEQRLTEKTKELVVKKRGKELEKLKKQLEKIKPLILEQERSVIAGEEALEELESSKKRFEELESIDSELKFLSGALKQLKTEASTSENEARMLEKTIMLAEKNLEKSLIEQERMKQIISKKAEVYSKMKKVNELKHNVQHLIEEKKKFSGFSQQMLDYFEQQLQIAIGMEKQTETKLENILFIKNELRKKQEQLEAKKKIVEGYKAEARKLEGLVEQLQLLESALLATQEQLRKNFVVAVNVAMHNIWQYIYPYKDFFSIRLATEGDYTLELLDNTGWLSADGIASGGERSIACLALRIAFALVLAPQLRWLVLDEPTHNLDSRAVEDLANVLRDRMSEFVEQVFLITHDSALESAVSGYLYRLERDKEKDGFTKIIQVSGPEG